MPSISRRSLLVATAASPLLWIRPSIAGAPPVTQVHLTMGSTPEEMVVSWVTDAAVSRPRVRLGLPKTGPGHTVNAQTRSYRDGTTKQATICHHARLRGLRPDTTYVYEVHHDGLATPFRSTFRTGPIGRKAFRFSSFGDQGAGSADYVAATPFGDYIVDQVEAQRPAVHLLNGDLCYGNLQTDAPAAWGAFMTNNQRSAAHRPWMPALGNHEIELGNGPQGFLAAQTRFLVPGNGTARFRGLWYSFTVGSVRFVCLQGDEAAYQDGGDIYVRGYSHGEQVRWADRELAAARRDPGIDWVVVFMHQCFASSALAGNGSDRGLREAFGDLFDRHDVDLVLTGHDHDYERSYLIKGHDKASETRTPLVADDALTDLDATKGAVHMVLGGGGSLPLNSYYGVQGVNPEAKVFVAKGKTVMEPAAWSAVRDPEYPYGYAVFDVDPGPRNGRTTMTVTYLRTGPARSAPSLPGESFTLSRPRGDSRRAGHADAALLPV